MLEASIPDDIFEICFYKELIFSDKNKQLTPVSADDFLRFLGGIIDHERVLHMQAGALSPQPPAPTDSSAGDKKRIAHCPDMSILAPSQGMRNRTGPLNICGRSMTVMKLL
ncbi:hypothetical protein FBZ98_11631 [Rhizobium sp. ERR 922]|nr:hypothetical protein FBZ98_11631 [Rhizobium sp. ERR 922]TWB87936.1 hypothetical protein FBZ97_11522 [Rhizobium sp. ERR 942]